MRSKMTKEIIMAGFGGQGILLMGRVLANAGLLAGLHVSWLPSYGPEMRGGTANCTVVLSSEPVLSPLVSKPWTVVALNRPSLDRFEPSVKPGGLLLVNSSLVDKEIGRQDMRAVRIPANRIAEDLGDVRIANMVALGAYLELDNVVPFESALDSLRELLVKDERGLHLLNEEALRRGAHFVKTTQN